MAFVVEDGSAKADATSYVSVTDADGYFADRGNTAWTGTNAVKQAALVKATDYIEGRFGRRFIGSKKTTTQALAWPRTGAADFADNEVPALLCRACCEYAVRALVAELAPDPEVDAGGLTVVVTKKKVGPIETEYAAQTGASSTPALFRPYPAADMLMRGLVYSASQVIR